MPPVPEDHVRLKNELLYLAQKQRARIDRLRHEADVQLERYAAQKKSEIREKVAELKVAVRALEPELDDTRRAWQKHKVVNTEHETNFARLSEQYRTTQARLKVLQEAISGAQQGTGEGRQSVAAMRDHLAEIDTDKVELRKKIQRALDCLVVDENMLKNRLEQEQEYAAQMREMVAAVEQEVAGLEQVEVQHRQLAADAQIMTDHLTEMKQKTNDLHDTFAGLRTRRRETTDDFLLEAGKSSQELTHQQSLLAMKTHTAKTLEKQVDYLGKQVSKSAPPPGGASSAIALWNKLEVLDSMLADLSQLKEQFEVRPEERHLLRDTTNQCNKAKAELNTIETRVDGKDGYRRKLVDEIVDMRHLLNEKLQEEDGLVAQLEQLLADLGEDVGHVRGLVDKRGFDDYASSDSEPDEFGFIRLDEEGAHDVEIITTSLDFSAADPVGSEAVQRFGNRQQGPLRAFAEARAAQLAGKPLRRLSERTPRNRDPTVERALMLTQHHAAEEVAANIRSRQEAAKAGRYDARMNIVLPDPQQVARNAALHEQVELWKEQQRGTARYRLGRESQPQLPQSSQPSPALHDATDASLLAGSQEDIAVQYLQRMVRGFTANMFFNGPAGPYARQLFMTKDLRRLAWRKPGAEPDGFDDEFINIADIRTVITGHRTDVFKQHLEKNAGQLRESCALSITTLQQTSLDLELDTADERDYWVQILTTTATEMKPDGIIATITATGNVKVIDSSHPDQRSTADEPFDRDQIVVKYVA